MDLRSIYVSNGVGISMLLMLLYASRSKILRRRLEDRLYLFMIFGVMLGCFMEAFSYTLDSRVFPGAIFLNYVANTYLFSVNLFLPFSVLVYIDLGLYGDRSRIWRCYKPQIIVGMVMFSLTILNLFVPVCFYITDGNVYHQLPVGYVYYFVILYYCITSIIVTKRYERENGAYSFFNINMFLVPVLTGAGLQFAFYGLSLAWLSSAVGIVGLYMMQQNETAYIDSLVDTYNRQYLDIVLSTWIARNRRFAGAMLDIDRFKKINDLYGHSEGDNALKTLTSILKQARSAHEWVFRFAVDEFIILKQTDSPEGLSPYLERVERGVAEYNRGDGPYSLSISYGVSFFDQGSVDAFMREMDEKMYEMKAWHHRDAAR